MHKFSFSLFSVFSVFALSSPAAGQSLTQDIPLGPDTLHLVVPDGYVEGHRSNDDNIQVIEFIPDGEIIEDWSSIFTLVLFDQGDADIERMRDDLQENFFSTCGGDWLRANAPPFQESGYDVAEWAEGCDMTISGPSKGHLESGIYKLSSGNAYTYMISIVYRSPIPETDKDKWLDFLAGVGWRN